MTLANKETLYHQLGSLLHAGFPIEQAADSLLSQAPSAQRRSALETLKQGLGNGKTIAQSLAPSVTPLELSVLSAAESGGRLGDGCTHLAEYYAMVKELRSMILVRLMYPVLLLHMLVLAMPMVQSVMGVGFQWATVGKQLFLLWGALAALYFGFRAIMGLAERNASVDKMVRLIPVAGKLWRTLAEGRFAQVLRIGVLAGRRTDEFFSLAAEASGSGSLREPAPKIAAAIAAGQPMGTFLRQLLAKDMADGLQTAEISGQIDKECERFVKLRQSEAQTTARLLGIALPALVYFIAMGLIVVKVVSFYSNIWAGYGQMLDM